MPSPSSLPKEFLRAAPPIFSAGVVFLFAVEVVSIVRRYSTSVSSLDILLYSAIWPSLIASLLISMGEILTTIALYMTTLAVVYVATGKAKWCSESMPWLPPPSSSSLPLPFLSRMWSCTPRRCTVCYLASHGCVSSSTSPSWLSPSASSASPSTRREL